MSIALFASVILISACDNDDELVAPPSVDVAPSTTQGLPGTEVNAEVKIDAPAGVSELIILKNGAAFDTESFDRYTHCKNCNTNLRNVSMRLLSGNQDQNSPADSKLTGNLHKFNSASQQKQNHLPRHRFRSCRTSARSAVVGSSCLVQRG